MSVGSWCIRWLREGGVGVGVGVGRSVSLTMRNGRLTFKDKKSQSMMLVLVVVVVVLALVSWGVEVVGVSCEAWESEVDVGGSCSTSSPSSSDGLLDIALLFFKIFFLYIFYLKKSLSFFTCC